MKKSIFFATAIGLVLGNALLCLVGNQEIFTAIERTYFEIGGMLCYAVVEFVSKIKEL
jgi:hypothetical protein